jgi:hypothetical protein
MSVTINIPEIVTNSSNVTLTKYSPSKALMIKAFLDEGYTFRRIQKEFDVSPHTILSIKRSSRFNPTQLQRVKETLANKFYVLASENLDNITPDKMENSSMMQNMMAAAIAVDKGRLLDGLSTANVGVVDVVKDTVQKLKELSQIHANIVESEAA